MSSALYQIEKLDDTNYDGWKVLMKSVLVHCDLWEYVSGDKEVPKEAAALAAWKLKDEKALATLILSVKSTQLLHVKNAKTSADAWIRLKEVHSPSGPARKVTIFKSLLNLKMCEGASMSEHLNKFFDLFEKLSELDIQLQDELLAIILLCSLSKNYDNFIIAIESRDELPSTSVLKTKLLEEEKRRESETKIEEPHETAFFANKQRNQQQSEKQNRPVKQRGKCYKCQKRGHFAAACRLNGAVKPNINCAMLNMSNTYTELNSSTWILDSGSTSHMCCSKSMFTYLKTHKEKVELAGDKYIFSEGVGVVCIETETTKLSLHNVLYVPDLKTNFLSVSKLTGTCKVIFDENYAKIISRACGTEAMKAKRTGDLFIYVPNNNILCAAMVNRGNIIEWHRKYGHLNMKSLELLSKNNMVRGMDIKNIGKVDCDICLKGKISALPFPKYSSRFSKNILEIIHSDVCGPMHTSSLSGAKYMVSFVDDFSRKIFIYFIKKKSDVFEKFKIFKATVERETGRKIKVFHSDNGGEYLNSEFSNFLAREGIRRQLSVPYTPQQNGVAERINRTLVEMSRCMLIDSKLPEFLWAEAINTAVYLRNRSPTKMLSNMTPYEAWSGRKPSVSHLEVFGRKGVVLDKLPGKSKFAAKGVECFMVGYASESKAYRLYNPKRRTVVIGRDVRFLCLQNFDHTSNHSLDCFSLVKNTKDTDADVVIPKEEAELSDDEDYNDCVEFEANAETDKVEPEIDAEPKNCVDSEHAIVVETDAGHSTDIISSNNEAVEEAENGESNSLEYRTRLRPRMQVLSHKSNFMNSDTANPLTVKDALQRPDAEKWRAAMVAEYNMLIKNQTWELVDIPRNRHPIKSKWVFNIKRDKNGAPVRYKARLVAKGCSQRYGVDYKEIFSPVVRYSSIRLILALAAEFNLFVHHMDVASAYLNGNLEEEVFMSQPEYFIDENNKGKVCRLRKAIYGLKQSGRNWNKELDSALTQIGFVKCNGDACVYVLKQSGEINIVAIYVDDILLACSNFERLESIKNKISQKFEVVDKGPIDQFVGIEITRGKDGIQISQQQLIRNLLDDFGMKECRSCTTPLDPGIKFKKCDDCSQCVKVDVKEYQSLIGSLTYLGVCTRPDIIHSVFKLAQFNTNPHVEHLNAAKHLLRYLNTTINLKLNYFQTGMKLKGYADADWGGNCVDRKSYTGFAFFLAGAAVSWDSKKQSTIALSSTEAEYVALSTASKEIVYLRRFLKEMGFDALVDGPTELFSDNLSAQKLAKNPVFHNRTKHIDIKSHYVRDVVEKEILALKYIPTDKMTADIFTKNLKKIKHKEFSTMLGLK